MSTLTREDRAELARLGVPVPTDDDALRGVDGNRTVSHWVYQYGATEQLVDMIAREWFESKLTLIPADTSIVAGDLAARLCKRLAATSVRRARTIAHEWESYADAITSAMGRPYGPTQPVELPPVTARQIMAASVTPQAWHRWSAAREHAATQILRAAGLPATRPDVWNPRHRQYVSRPDSVAYRGVTRYTLPRPCRYGKNGLQPAATTDLRPMFHVATDGTVEVRHTLPVVELLTSLPVRKDDGSTRRGWRGFRLVTWTASTGTRRASATEQAERMSRRKARATIAATGTRGRAVGPWSISDRSLPRATSKLSEQVATLESVIRTSTVGAVITFDDGTSVTVLSPAQVTYRDRAYPVRELARRAALAGLTLA